LTVLRRVPQPERPELNDKRGAGTAVPPFWLFLPSFF
jgi:hypothetical protein